MILLLLLVSEWVAKETTPNDRAVEKGTRTRRRTVEHAAMIWWWVIEQGNPRHPSRRRPVQGWTARMTRMCAEKAMTGRSLSLARRWEAAAAAAAALPVKAAVGES